MFQRVVEIYLVNLPLFLSAISRYLVSNQRECHGNYDLPELVSIRYIAVLGFQPGLLAGGVAAGLIVSIRYIAVLGFQLWITVSGRTSGYGFHPLYRGTWFPTGVGRRFYTHRVQRFHPLYRGTWFPTTEKNLINLSMKVSIRYIAVLGFQL